jgi:hypothetical protein
VAIGCVQSPGHSMVFWDPSIALGGGLPDFDETADAEQLDDRIRIETDSGIVETATMPAEANGVDLSRAARARAGLILERTGINSARSVMFLPDDTFAPAPDGAIPLACVEHDDEAIAFFNLASDFSACERSFKFKSPSVSVPPSSFVFFLTLVFSADLPSSD